MIYLSAADTETVLDWASATRCMRDAYAADVPPKAIPGRLVAVDGSTWIRCMPAIPSFGRYMGSKQISRTRDGKVIYVITLFDKQTGELAYLIDGIAITGMRTAATSAVALDALSRPGPLSIGVIGSGLEARMHVKALASIREISGVSIYSPSAPNRERLAAEFRSTLGLRAQAAASPEAAVKGASHVVAAARSRDESPVLYGSWLAPGTVVVSVGSTTPTQREVDVSVIRLADFIVSDVPHELAHDTGDMIAATSAGATFADKLFSLQDLLQKRIARERTMSGIVVFKSVGSALQDVAFAEHVANMASAKGLGSNLNVQFAIKQSIGRNT